MPISSSGTAMSAISTCWLMWAICQRGTRTLRRRRMPSARRYSHSVTAMPISTPGSSETLIHPPVWRAYMRRLEDGSGDQDQPRDDDDHGRDVEQEAERLRLRS